MRGILMEEELQAIKRTCNLQTDPICWPATSAEHSRETKIETLTEASCAAQQANVAPALSETTQQDS